MERCKIKQRPHQISVLDQVREISAEWMREYNEERPHETLGGMPTFEFRRTKRSEVLL